MFNYIQAAVYLATAFMALAVIPETFAARRDDRKRGWERGWVFEFFAVAILIALIVVSVLVS
jgi:small-conductance mechanosensitive channel